MWYIICLYVRFLIWILIGHQKQGLNIQLLLLFYLLSKKSELGHEKTIKASYWKKLNSIQQFGNKNHCIMN